MKLDKTAEEILQLLCDGYSVKEVAAKLKISFWDLRRKIDGLRIVYGAKSITHLVHLYTKETIKSVN